MLPQIRRKEAKSSIFAYSLVVATVLALFFVISFSIGLYETRRSTAELSCNEGNNQEEENKVCNQDLISNQNKTSSLSKTFNKILSINSIILSNLEKMQEKGIPYMIIGKRALDKKYGDGNGDNGNGDDGDNGCNPEVDLGSEDIQGILPIVHGGTGQDTLNDLIILGDHTIGNYISSLSGSDIITVSGSLGENSSLSLDIADNSITSSKIKVFGDDAFNYILVSNGDGTFHWEYKPQMRGRVDNFTPGSVLFADSTGNIFEDNSNFFWDDTNNRLGIGTNSPSAKLQVDTGVAATKGLIVKGAASQSVNLQEWQDSLGSLLMSVDSSGQLGLGAITPGAAFDVYNKMTVDSSGAISSPKVNKVIVVDGVTYSQDDTGINAAIAALPAAGGEIFLPEGTYSLSATININKSNFILRGAGEGTILQVAAATQINAITYGGGDDVVIRDLTIDGNKANNTDAGVATNQNGIYGSGSAYSYRIKIINCAIKNNYEDGIYIYNWHIQDPQIINNRIFDNDDKGMQVGPNSGALTGGVISDNKVYSNGGDGIFSNGGATVKGNNVNNNGAYGIAAYNGTVVSANVVYSNTGSGIYADASPVTGNRVYSNGVHGVYVKGSTSVTGNIITDNTSSGVYTVGPSYENLISSNQVSGNGEYGIRLQYWNTNKVIVSDNMVSGNTYHGIYFQNNGSSDNNLVITGNLVYNNDDGTDSYDGINIGGTVRKGIISNNRALGNGRWGLYGTAMSSFIVSNNYFEGNTTGGMSIPDNNTIIDEDDTTLTIKPFTGDYVRIGDAGLASLVNTNDDLFVSGGLEVDSFSVFGGNVGIGTDTPAAKLEVEIDNTDNVTGLLLDMDDVTNNPNVLVINNAGTGYSVLVDEGDAVFDANLVVGGSTSRINTLLNGSFSLGGDDLFIAGDAGIKGDVYTDGSFIAGNSLTLTDGSITQSTGLALNVSLGGAAGDDFIIDNTTLVVESDEHQVGIGTATPGYTLHTYTSPSGYAGDYINTRVEALGSLDSTVGARAGYGGYFTSNYSRSAGANWVSNYGLYAEAGGGATALYSHGVHGKSTTTDTTRSVGVYGEGGFGIMGESTAGDTIGVVGKGGTVSGWGYQSGGIGVVAAGDAWDIYASGGGDNYFKGDVGIGTNSPDANLDIEGDVAEEYIRFSNGSLFHSISCQYNGNEGMWNYMRFVVDNGFTAGRTDVMTLLGNGNVGIGRTPAANDLEVEGTASKAVAGEWLANSDIRIKKDITDLDNALGIINSLRPIKFHYTDEYKQKHPSIEDKYYYNFIAQEFQNVFPGSVKDSGEEGYLQMDTYNVRLYLVSAIQELTKGLWVDTYGNVGIGTREPYFKLDIAGDLRIQDSNKLYFGGSGSSDTDIKIYQNNKGMLVISDDTIVEGMLIIKRDLSLEAGLEVVDHIKVGADTAGEIVLPAGDKEVQIKFDKLYNSTPIVNITAEDYFGDFTVSDKDESGFKIKIPKTSKEDIKFQWFVVSN